MNTSIIHYIKSASRYIPVDGSKIGSKIIGSDYYMTSVKFDGYLSFLVVQSGKATLYKRNGEAINVPQIIKEAEKIRVNVVLAGELCCFIDNKSTSHREVGTALVNPERNDLRFAAFDIIEQHDIKVELQVRERYGLLKELLKATAIFAIEQQFYESRSEISKFYESAIQNGAEGAVVKTSGGLTYKIKEVVHLDLVVLGYAEGIGDRGGQLREVLLGFALGDGKFQVVGLCGSGFSDLERKELPSIFNQNVVKSDITEVSGAGTAFIFIKPEIVIEISCLDLINLTHDEPIRKATLIYDFEKGYQSTGNHPSISIISPNFVRIRNDKKANEQDAGTNQAYALVAPIIANDSNLSETPSQIVAREVYIKSGKTATAVRKFVGLKTNKEKSGKYSPFVLVYTDYSADRKTPIDQELFLCEDENELNQKLTVLKTEYIKKGWEIIK